MFTGIVEAAVPVRSVEARGRGARLVLPAPSSDWRAEAGDSIAVSGCCLTAVEPGAGSGASGEPALAFDLSAETLERTWFDRLEPGRRVNLERALRLGDRLGGHLVSGHVDGQARLVEARDSDDGGRLLTFEVDPGLDRWLIQKGSVTLDGVSLTVVDPRGRVFDVAAIPLTLELTSLGELRPGDAVNVEADLVGKWIEKLFPGR